MNQNEIVALVFMPLAVLAALVVGTAPILLRIRRYRKAYAQAAKLRALAVRQPVVSWVTPEPAPYGRDRIGSDPDTTSTTSGTEYQVTVSRTFSTTVTVYADSAEAAADKVNRRDFELPPVDQWHGHKDWLYQVTNPADPDDVYELL